jgi:CBS domain-containing protein
MAPCFIDASRDEVVAAGLTMGWEASRLALAGLGVEEVGRSLSSIVDQMTARFLDLAQIELGPAPAPWAWLALGSLGRRERLLVGDQDHALVYDGTTNADPYFSDLAHRVVADLESAGIPPCPSNVMASQPGFRLPLDLYLARLREWMVGDEEMVFFSEIEFDCRRVAGTLIGVDSELSRIASAAAEQPGFLLHLAELAVSTVPPVGMFGQLDRSLNLKLGAVNPATELARFMALASGVVVTNTYERLRRVTDLQGEWADAAKALDPAYRFIQGLRLAEQVRAFHEGTEVGNLLDLDQLDHDQQRRLRETLRTIKHLQSIVHNWMTWAGSSVEVVRRVGGRREPYQVDGG